MVKTPDSAWSLSFHRDEWWEEISASLECNMKENKFGKFYLSLCVCGSKKMNMWGTQVPCITRPLTA